MRITDEFANLPFVDQLLYVVNEVAERSRLHKEQDYTAYTKQFSHVLGPLARYVIEGKSDLEIPQIRKAVEH